MHEHSIASRSLMQTASISAWCSALFAWGCETKLVGEQPKHTHDGPPLWPLWTNMAVSREDWSLHISDAPYVVRTEGKTACRFAPHVVYDRLSWSS